MISMVCCRGKRPGESSYSWSIVGIFLFTFILFRVFFEKSRIPVEELRHIWQLCDVTRDGALSLAEFTAAMHLVVLRRNNIPLPATLPQCLHPTVLKRTTLANHMLNPEPAEADLLHLDEDEEDNTDNTIVGMNTGMSLTGNSTSSARMLNENAAMNLSTLSASSQVCF